MNNEPTPTYHPLDFDWGRVEPRKEDVVEIVSRYLNRCNLDFAKAHISLKNQELQVNIPIKEESNE